MSDDPSRLEEDRSQTDSTVKRAGRARICKQCRFTTTDAREFSNHRLHAHAEENPEEKPTLNRKTGAKRRSSSVVSGSTEDIKKKGTTNEKSEETKVNDLAESNISSSENNYCVVPPVPDNFQTDEISKNKEKDNNKDINILDISINKENGDKLSTNAVSVENKTKPNKESVVDPEMKMEDSKISAELLQSLALAPRKQLKEEDVMSFQKSPATEKVLIEKQNGMTEEVLLIKREEDADEEPRLVIADETDSEIMDHSGLERNGNIQNRTYLCNLCDFSTSNAKIYLHHQKDIHNPEIIIYECDICDYATKYKQKLPRHRRLHFTGKDGLIDSELDSSLNERELRDFKEHSSFNADFVNGEEEMDEEGDDEDDEEIAGVLNGAPQGLTPLPGAGAPVEKKKRIRQEVDPLKYFEVMDENGVKYACSKCGNVYKWRKSLNKHWKEKHFGEVPDLTKPPPTLQNFTLFSRYKPKAGGQPPPPAAPNVVYGAAIPSPTNQQKANNRVTPTSKPDTESRDLANLMMPRQIGPFISTSSPDLFHSQLLSLATQAPRMPQNHHEMRKMVDELQRRSNALKGKKLQFTDRTSPYREVSQNEPIDYSKPLDFSKKPDVKLEPHWGDNNSESADSLQDIPLSMAHANSQIALAMKQSNPATVDGENPVLQCTKCSFVAKTLVDYSAHMSLHLNKRAFKCAECQSHFNGIDDLNKHFLEQHAEKIQEHKEAIQKIPHGLQQTYHLLKMPLDSISNLSSQELLSNEPKQLKCSMCSFVAKWPAELQKHAVSHSEERPFVCMVCGSTYKWKWDLVKHFEKSHNSLPNPYKRREGGGIAPSGTSSPSTPPLESISRAAALMEAGMNGPNYVMDETPPLKKRRLSETETMQDTDDFYRELLERQIKHRREMAQLSESLQLPNRPQSAPFNKDNENGKEDYLSGDSMDSFTPKHQVAEALKNRIKSGKQLEEESPKESPRSGKSDVPLPYKCSVCEYRARWPSEISQHMKNHSNEKPFHCPRCSYKSKWKWDVVKHLRRCGGGTVHDVIDTTKLKKMAPPNVMVLPQGSMHQNQQQQHVQPSQKLSPGQSIFSPSQRAKSLSPAINNLTRLSNTNFSLAGGGQDHQAMMELMAQNGLQGGSLNGQQGFSPSENDGLFRCHECPFVGNTHAELKRHAVLHSENKPFSCNMCGYSSRWKCDLKKHMKVYNHFDTSIQPKDESFMSTEKFVEPEEESDEEKSTLYMCPQCPYNSYKKSAFDHHLLIHGNLINQENEMEQISSALNNSLPTSSFKYRCTKCDYQGNDLSSFLQHKRAHANGSITVPESRDSLSPVMSESRSVSPAPSEVSNRTLHLKHRRKPIKQFRCSKCPYICFKHSALVNHESLHQSQGNDAYLCMFCDYNVFSKNLLLQHMRLHPEYNPAEDAENDTRVSAAELMEMEELEEKELAGEDRKDPSFPEENNNIDEYESGINFMTASSSQSNSPPPTLSLPVSFERSPENNNLKGATDNNTATENGGGLPCEWCPATFPNVVTLYQHAQSLHPSQLKAQEAGDIAAKQAPSKTSQLEQIVRERQREYQVYHQTAVHQPQMIQQFQNHLLKKMIPLAPKPQPENSILTEEEMLIAKQQMAALNARKSASQQKRGRSFQCTKCSFTAPNAVTYLRHIERHGSNCKHTCLYCDYSIDRLNLLYQHMKGTHGSKWTGTTEEKIHLSVSAEDSNNNIIDDLHMDEDSMAMDELNGSFNSSTNDSVEGYFNMKNTALDELQKHSMKEQMKIQLDYPGIENTPDNGNSLAKTGPKPLLQLKGSTIFKDTLLQVCYLDGRKHYKCPRCLYINNNAANTCNHVKQHGQNKKYTCQFCDYSVDNYKHIQHHVDTVHPKEPNFVMMNSSPSTLVEDDFPEEIGQYPNPTNGNVQTYRTEGRDLQVNHLQNETAGDGEKMDSRSSDRVRFKCSCCPFFTYKKNEILKHRLNHVNKFELTCQLCTFSSNQSEELQSHLKFHQNSQKENHSQDITLDPYLGNFNILDIFPDDISDEEMQEDKADEEDQVFGEAEESAEDLEDETEVALMEAELRQTCTQPNDKSGSGTNADGGAENDIQFRTFKCKLCPYSSNSNTEFKKHGRLHGTVHKFKCDYCDYSLDRVNLICQHRKLHFSEPDFDQTPLMKTLLNKDHEEYESMLTKIGNEIAFPPVETNVKTVEESAEFNYFMKNEQDDKIRYVCNKCPYKSQALKSFKCHIQMHGLARKYQCDYCDWSTERINLLCQHRRVHASESGFDPNPEDIVFLNRDYILEHEGIADKTVNFSVMELHKNSFLNSEKEKLKEGSKSGQKMHNCKICPYRTEDYNSYSYHKKLHCIQALYNCSECSYSINNMGSLKEHIKLHKKERQMLKLTLGDGAKRQKCPKCPYNSPNKNSLVNHMTMHSSGRKHECTHCDFSTDKLKLLEFHLKVHEEGYSDSDSLEEEISQLMKRSPDAIGPRLYFSTSNLNEMDSDSNNSADMDHSCDKCPFSTPSKDELGHHILQHDSQTKSSLNCTFCTFSCSKEDELLQHAQVHFPSMKLDWDMMKQLRKQNQSYRKNLSFDDGSNKQSDGRVSDENGEPDSTVSDTVGDDQETSDMKDSEKTKVYVCQFCEREFNCKTTMLQHEKQHLVGS